ncbi:hypothetical protein PPL_05869 [Heterostelium album PN500]|uniref:Cathepsin propeptide inhibitor domain-containing protein n=1 Tax=Heterostelium pallidum (strain ATCC 26659 / Pp 5 / PN500) TaxID=670386 RepID=D3BBK1_HETP5|nr:hypothetical protein PPL_05869 [Heterostelium album PN500]EFA81034.1 hypothetical protein PPL_05869 [Heterostelium album PN500]|eukprot:XP_020433152.1 hypothetical protein PPL_05869 [Heterostelium album PN500]
MFNKINNIKQYCLIYCFVVYLLMSGTEAVPSNAVLFSNFQTWATQYGKQYDSAEMQQRFQNWKTNTLSVAENNANTAQVDIDNPTDEELAANPEVETTVSYPAEQQQVLGVNQFSDMTYQEFVNTYTGGMDAMESGTGATSATLSTYEIAGVAVGCVLFAAIVTAGTIFGYKRYKKLHTNKDNHHKDMEVGSPELNVVPISSTSETISTSPPPSNTTEILHNNNQMLLSYSNDNNSSLRTNVPHGGVDIVCINSQRHNSITGRAVPIKLDSKLIVNTSANN